MEKSCIIGGNIARKKITIYKENRRLDQSVLSIGFLGENKIEKIEFIVPEEYKEFSKKACFSTIDGTFSKVFDNVTSNILTIDKEITKYNELDCNIQFFKTIDDDEIIAKTSNLHLVIEDSIVCDDDVENDDPKVLILDSLIEKVTNLDKVISENETQREEYIKNLKSSVENGDFNGKDATINGFNTLNIVAGTNIDLKQENETLKINNTYQYDDIDLVRKIDNINDNFKNYSLITETGNKLDLTIDSKTYIMTLKLKDKDDHVLSTGSVDLPIESMIINVTYDNDNEKLTFTLQNGIVIDVPLDSLISGLVNETDLKSILKDYAKTTDVPTKVSELENDSNYVKNTDYAAENKVGVIKTNIPFYATAVTSDGILYATPRTLEQYTTLNDTGIISKGTLENVIAGKNLETTNNKVNFVNENSTDTQYPSAKCTYEIKNNLDRLKDNVLEVGEVSDTYIHVEDSFLNELKELSVDGVCKQQATPSPDYPQEIKTITDNLKLTSCNKNLFDGIVEDGSIDGQTGENINSTTIARGVNYIPVEENKQYIFSINNVIKQVAISYYDKNYNFITTQLNYNTPFTPVKKSKYIRIRCFQTDYTLFTTGNIQIEQGTTVTSYVDHLYSQITAKLPEGEFIGKIDDTYKDTLKVVYKEDRKHHLILNKIISKTVLNGTQPINYSKVINDDKFVAQFNIGTAIKPSSTMISDKFIYMSNGWASNSENISTGGSKNNLLQIKILQSRLEEISSNGLTNWLSTHPVEVYYVLENPYEINLGIVDMPLSYSEVTNIFTDSDLLPKINAKYYKDFKLSIENYINSYIDNKLNELQSTTNDVPAADNTQSDENQNSDLS